MDRTRRRRGRLRRSGRILRGGGGRVRVRALHARARARRAHRGLARGAGALIAALVAAASVAAADPVQPRLLAARGGAIVRVDPAGTGSRPLLSGDDAEWSPDGTLLVFVRDGDLWLANADGSGKRELLRTPNGEEA